MKALLRMEGEDDVDQQFEDCMQACWSCVSACNEVYDACLKEENVTEMGDCIRVTIECAQSCAYAAEAISRHSMFSEEICALCAVVCEACGSECQKYEEDPYKKCSTAALACAKQCRQVGI